MRPSSTIASALFAAFQVFVALLSGCTDGGKGSSSVELDTGAGYEVETLDDSECTAVPGPRRFAQMASFYTDEPIELSDGAVVVQVQRGMALYGGFDDPVLLDDLWVYDLTTPADIACPWHEISSSTSGIEPTYGAAFAFDQSAGEFILAGGVREDGTGTTYASDEIDVIFLAALSTGFGSFGTLPELDYEFFYDGDPECDVESISHTYEDGDCDPTYTCYYDPCTNAVVGSCGEDPDHQHTEFGCTDDPVCEYGESDATITIGAPGLWGAASWYDANDRALWLAGGSTGCEGTNCADWQGLFDADTTGVQSLTITNSTWAVRVDIGGTTAATRLDLSDLSGTDWPSQATFGVRGAAGAEMTADWSLATKEWTSASGSGPLLLGGTLHQEAAPSVVWTREVTDYGSACPDHPIEWGETVAVGDEVFPDWADGLLGGGDGVQEFDTTALSRATVSISPSLDRLMDAGAATLEPGAVAVVVGGRTSSETTGSMEARIVDVGGASQVQADYSSRLGRRYGASVVYEPVTRAAYVFGGHATNSDVFTVSGPLTRVANGGATQEMDGGMGVELTYVSATDWEHTVIFTVRNECSTSGCFADRLRLVVPTQDTTEVGTLVVDATIGGVAVPLDVLLDSTELRTADGLYLTELTYLLPKILADGDEAEITASWSSDSVAAANDAVDATSDRKMKTWTGATGAAVTTNYAQPILPLWLDGDDDSEASSSDPVAIAYTYVYPPAGYTAIAPGERTETSSRTEFGSYDAIEPSEYNILLFESMDYVTSIVTAGSRVIDVYADGAFTLAQRTDLDAYLAGSGTDDLDADVAWVESKLGNIQQDDYHMVFTIPGTTALDAAGSTEPGFIVVQCFDPTGAEWSASDPGSYCSDDGTAVHEVAHLRIGAGAGYTDSSAWVGEGLPVLSDWIRHPDGEAMLYTAQSLVEEGYLGNSTDLETDEFMADYFYGPFVLAQYHHTMLASGAAAADVWGVWSNVATTYAGSGFDASDVQSALSGLTNGSTFYGEWVAAGRLGIPIVSLTAFDQPSSGDTADTGVAGSNSLEVAQVQQALYGFDLFSNVPWFLGCYTDDSAPAPRPYAECQAVEGSLEDETPYALSAASTTVSLTPSTELGGAAELPAFLGVLANETLLPENVPTAALSDTTWHLWCDPLDLTGECANDGDVDGHPTLGDCDDADASVYPGAAETVHDGIDYNCDGWSSPP